MQCKYKIVKYIMKKEFKKGRDLFSWIWMYITAIHLAARGPSPALEFVFIGPLTESE